MSTPLRTFALATAAALAAAAPAHAVPAWALTTTHALVTFDTANPMNGSMAMAITGTGSERIMAIDIRPTTNVLYGVGSSGGVYTITAGGAATMVGMLDAAPMGAIGIDFNPAADLSGAASLRVITASGQNYAFNANTNANVASEGAIGAGHPSVAYANNDLDAGTGTALYYIDTASDTLKVAAGNFNNTAAAPITITTVGALGIDANGVSGFDITGANLGFAAFMDADTGKSMLYGIDLATGAATSMGDFGVMGSAIAAPAIAGIAVSPVPEPGSYALLLAGLAGLGAIVRRRSTRG